VNKIGLAFAAFLLIVIGLGANPVAFAGGLSTQIGEAVIENLQIGQTYNLADLANLYLIVTNSGDAPVDLKMDVQYPDSGQLRLDAAAIPDTSWISLSEDYFVLRAAEKAVSNISISIPHDEKLLGGKYQFNIWSHTVPRDGGGMFLAYGLRTRIIFTIDTVAASADELPMTSSTSLDFSLSPAEIFVENVTPGLEFDVDANAGVVLQITNTGDEEQILGLESRPVRESVTSLASGYRDTPDASYLRFDQSTVTIPPNETRSVRMFLEFPGDETYSGQQYMFVIHAYSQSEGVTSGVYSRLYAAMR
jgi:hypothetical protein